MVSVGEWPLRRDLSKGALMGVSIGAAGTLNGLLMWHIHSQHYVHAFCSPVPPLPARLELPSPAPSQHSLALTTRNTPTIPSHSSKHAHDTSPPTLARCIDAEYMAALLSAFPLGAHTLTFPAVCGLCLTPRSARRACIKLPPHLGGEGHDWQVRLMREHIPQHNLYSWTSILD